jgi:phospholipase C
VPRVRHQSSTVVLFAATLAGCLGQAFSPNGAQASAAVPAAGARAAGNAVSGHPAPARKKQASPIQHVVIVIQENRSLNNLFMSYPNANTVTSGKIHTGKTIKLKSFPFEKGANVVHNLQSYLAACDGTGSLPGTNCKMDGFDLEIQIPSHIPYGYVPQSETQPYWSMAQQYVLDDMMFASNLDSSFTAHQYLIAAQAQSSVNDPNGAWGCDGKPGDLVDILGQQRTVIGTQVPCFGTVSDPSSYLTIGDELDRAGLTWRFYAPSTGGSSDDSVRPQKHSQSGGLWSAYRAVNHIRNGADWGTDVISPQTQFLVDVQAGTLQNVTWIVPSFADSDHPGSHSATGPSWVASVVNAVGQSQFWNSTAIIVVWDDWGGWYDPIPPPFQDYDGDGFRVPAICISPYAHQGTVDHTQYEFGSILRFVENNFGLGQLAQSDARATPVDKGCINYQRSPRKFVPISSPVGASYFIHEKPDFRPPDTDF